MACLFGHKWDGCKCLRCGKIRNEQHKWNGCQCIICRGWIPFTVNDVGRITDRAILEQIIHGIGTIFSTQVIRMAQNRLSELRVYDIIKIADPVKLIAAMKEKGNADILRAIIEKLTDQDVLINIASDHDIRSLIRIKAAEKLIDKTLSHKTIVSVFKDCKDEIWCGERYKEISDMIEQLTAQANQDVLTDVANDSDVTGLLRMKAAEKLIDKTLAQKIFAILVKDCPDRHLRKAAYEKITDRAVLEDISNDPFVQRLLEEKAHLEKQRRIEKEKQARINNCKNHVWEMYNGGHYIGRVCKICGASEISDHNV